MPMKSHFLTRFLVITTVIILAATLLPGHVLAAPLVSIHPRQGGPGTSVTIDCSNFTSYADDVISVYFDDSEVTGTTTKVPASGVFRVVFKVPATARPGDRFVGIKRLNANSIAGDFFNVPAPEVRCGTLGGAVGTKVQVSGRGFTSGKPVHVAYYYDDKSDDLGTYTAGDTGEISFTITVPASQRGKHVLAVSDADRLSAVAEFEVIPSVTLQPAKAASGEKVTLIGMGFTAGNEVTVGLLNKTVAYAKPQERGSFAGQFIVPEVRAGTYLVAVKTDEGETQWTPLTVISRIVAGKAGGEVGATVTIDGASFEATTIVDVTYDSTHMVYAATDETGAFGTEFIVPVSAHGTHVITATDGVETQQAFYVVESEPPAPPVPLDPRRGTEATEPVALSWEAVYDVSQPLTYTLQIARNLDFFHPVMVKSGLTISHYTLSALEQLTPNRKGTYYYWRVRATDGASNVGEWSEGAAFRIKPTEELPSWGRSVLAGIMAMLLVLYAIQMRNGLKTAE